MIRSAPGEVCCRPAVGCCWQVTVGRVSHRGREPGQEGSVGAEFHDDLEFWRWFVAHGLASRGEQFTSAMYNIVTRPPQLTLFSDASEQAVGGYCSETGQHWRYDLSAEEQSRCCGSTASLVGVDDVSVKVGRVCGLGSA